MVLVIIAGHIDLSVGSVAAFVGIIVAIVDARLGPALVAAASCSAWPSARSSAPGRASGSAYVGIPAFIVTLAGMLIFRGANQFVGKSQHGPGPRRASRFIGGGYLPEVGPDTGYNNLTLLLGLLARRRRSSSARVRSRRSSRQDRRRRRGPLWITVQAHGPRSASSIFGATLLVRLAAASAPASRSPGIILGALVLLYCVHRQQAPSSAATSTRSAATGTPPSFRCAAASGSTSSS